MLEIRAFAIVSRVVQQIVEAQSRGREQVFGEVDSSGRRSVSQVDGDQLCPAFTSPHVCDEVGTGAVAGIFYFEELPARPMKFWSVNDLKKLLINTLDIGVSNFLLGAGELHDELRPKAFQLPIVEEVHAGHC